MSNDDNEWIEGSGNVFADFGHPDAETKMIKATLAAGIIKIMDEKGIGVREASRQTGITAADLSRVRNVDLGRYSIDRLVRFLNALGGQASIVVKTSKAA